MQERGIYIMSQKELKRLHLIHRLIDKTITQTETANLLDLSTRQVRRIKDRVTEEGDKGIIHKSRGHPSPNSIPQDIKDNIITLCKTKYDGFSPTLASEKLFEINKIKISRETLRGWFKDNSLPYKTRKKRPHRSWRERKHRFGEMIQVDGSHHKWFEERGPECVLMGYIDDANNNVFARFYGTEGTLPFMDSFKRYISRYGLPQSIYIDRHAAYKANAKPSIEDELNNREPQSQVQRALKELEVDVIYAYSAPAKGRIERLFRTFQDRLVKEMRLKGIKSAKEGNSFLAYYLPIHNKRFKVEPIEKGNLHRPLLKTINLDKILCIKTEHVLNNDSTVVHNKKLYHVLDKTYAAKVVVEEKPDGVMLITHNGKSLKYRQIMQRPKQAKPVVFKAKNVWRPPMNHPYKRPMFLRYQHINSYSQKEKSSKKEKELLLV